MGSISEPILMDDNQPKIDKPVAIQLVENLKKSALSYRTYRALVLILTFLSYTTYHLTRKTTSAIKSTLDPNSSSTYAHARLMMTMRSTTTHHHQWYRNNSTGGNNSTALLLASTSGSGWAPFNGPDGTELLGYLDVAFLSMYATSQFFSGQIGDRMDLRLFLTVGMLGTGFFTAAFGFAYWLEIHSFYYFLIVQMLAGVMQSTGWPSVVAVVGNWFGKRRRGLIMGIWNAHTSVGNITGSLIAANLLQYGWGWSMVVPGLIIIVMGLVIYVTLPVSPLSVGIDYHHDTAGGTDAADDANTEQPGSNSNRGEEEEEDKDGDKAIGFCAALKIPGVVNYALCLFFVKLVAYTFLYWLPFYISYTEIGGEYLSSQASGNLSTLFDVGGVFGGILAGYISDKLNARGITSAAFTFASIPALYVYKSYGDVSIYVNGALMLIAGVFVNAPYALITTAVSADLGTHPSLRGHSRARATVASIIDGTGSFGAAIGPLLTGYVLTISWNAVFNMLMSSALLAGVLMGKLVWDEVVIKLRDNRSIRSSQDHRQVV